MFFQLFILFGQIILCKAARFHCDFETDCNDFLPIGVWDKTDGYNPQPIDHDHTLLNIKAGHYIYYNPGPGKRGLTIQGQNWSQPSTQQYSCFQVWYYSTLTNYLFTIQAIQGEGVEAVRTLVSVIDQNVSTTDWTLVNVRLPNEKLAIYIKVDITQKHLTFDDLSIDYCDGPIPPPPKVLFSCDFESSCSEYFISLPMYSYQWLILNASDAYKIDYNTPPIDYTFGNQSGHYVFLPVKTKLDNGRVGYLHLQQQLQITSEQSYCLNFQYYTFPSEDNAYLKIYAWSSDDPNEVQELWPGKRPYYNLYRHRWSWGIVNLPIGNYSLLFRGSTLVNNANSFALDNIDITSCDYPSSYVSYDSLLSFSCDFDNLTTCDMFNDEASSTYNFTVLTAETIPNQELGPDQDHTSNSTTGGFLYWNTDTQGNTSDRGRIYVAKAVEQNSDMCIQFAYYVKSSMTDNNTIVIRLSNDQNSNTILWYQTLSNSYGWQTVLLPVSKITETVQFYFEVYRMESALIAVAFDDIVIDQCNSFIPTTTTIITTTTEVTDSTTSITTTTITMPITTTPQSTSPDNASYSFYVKSYDLIICSFLFQIVRYLFSK